MVRIIDNDAIELQVTRVNVPLTIYNMLALHLPEIGVGAIARWRLPDYSFV